jgi:hypothetical protein
MAPPHLLVSETAGHEKEQQAESEKKNQDDENGQEGLETSEFGGRDHGYRPAGRVPRFLKTNTTPTMGSCTQADQARQRQFDRRLKEIKGQPAEEGCPSRFHRPGLPPGREAPQAIISDPAASPALPSSF